MKFPGPDASREEVDAFLVWKGLKAPETVLAPRIPLPPPAPRCLYTPADVDAAHDAWKANCGPTALAALLGMELAAVRPAFPWFPERPWSSPSQIMQAIVSARGEQNATRLSVDRYAGARGEVTRLPSFGLATIQIDGPWCQLSNPRVAYRYTHLVASQKVDGEVWVYDVNAGPDERPGAWGPSGWWAQHIMPLLVQGKKGATGWFVKVSIEVRR